MSERDDDRARIRALLQTIQDAWLSGKPDDIGRALAPCFHDKVVFRGPDFSIVARGAAEAIASYREFARNATIQNVKLSEPEIDLAGDTAIATYAWSIVYRLDAGDNEESGHDTVVFTRDEAQWLVRWRSVIA